MKTIAGIQFTENGILIERKYQQANQEAKPRIKEELFTGKFVEIAKRLAKTRMAHCYKQLHSNFAHAHVITPQSIIWNNGHFEVPVWEALEAVLSIEDVRNLTKLQAQQLIRVLLLNNTCWAYDYDVATWERIDNSDIKVPEEFMLFITEHIICFEQ